MALKVCPDYMSTGLLRNRFTPEKGEHWVYVDDDFINYISISNETRELLALCQQIFDQIDSWSSTQADYEFPHFIRKEQYEILCKITAQRIQEETGVETVAEFYWDEK